MGQVVEADFESQVVHAVDPDDEDWKAACGAVDVSFVANVGSTLRKGLQWCPGCVRALKQRKS